MQLLWADLMSTDYEKYYQETQHALGEPTREFVQFFESYPKQNAQVLDVGCGQGRDALFIARLGHSVVGVDISPSGVSDMIAHSNTEDLDIIGEIADIRAYKPKGKFNIVLIDRTLHMLNEADRLDVLSSLICHVAESGYLLIADERTNMAGFHGVLETSEISWQINNQDKGFLFAVRTN